MKKQIIGLFLVMIIILLTVNSLALAKTLTNHDVNSVKSAPNGSLSNKDIERLKGQQNKGVPTYNSNPSFPAVPGSSSGIPAIPPPRGNGKDALIIKKHLPYKQWEDEYQKYFKEYYNNEDLKLKPRMIALHYSKTDNFTPLWWTFVNGGIYDGTRGHLSVHYVVDKDGSIYELMPLDRKARGTYGVNHVAISIDLIGKNEKEILNNQRQMEVSFALVRWLMQKFNIPKEKVLSHDEIALGKELVEEYTDYKDKKYPDRYPPTSKTRGPGKAYMYKLRYYLVEPR
ncbi:MAG: peptidoglycan recognition family protein [Vulcanimicrobiota bacterium]